MKKGLPEKNGVAALAYNLVQLMTILKQVDPFRLCLISISKSI